MDPVLYATKAAAALLSMGVVADGVYDEEGWYGLGDYQLVPFETDGEHEYGFDWCIVYGKPKLMVVPVEGEVQPRCPRCGQDVADQHGHLVFGDGESEPDIDYAEARVTCPRCAGVFRLDELRDALGEGIYLTDKYVNFDDGIPKLRREWLDDFDKRVGVKHVVRTYWST